jgi:hypothetical protein
LEPSPVVNLALVTFLVQFRLSGLLRIARPGRIHPYFACTPTSCHFLSELDHQKVINNN